MRAVIQRVSNASVSVGGEIVSSIGLGLCVLIGMSRQDTVKDLEYIADKILKLKLFEDSQKKRWASSVVDKQFEILCVSQFTLYHSLKGNKPSFHNAMCSAESEPLYRRLLETLRTRYRRELVKDGIFGAAMAVTVVNDGPVTVQIESPKLTVDSDQKTETKEAVVTEQKMPNGE